ncbi:TTAGGG repeat binding factor [Saitoella coloradoensis]
MADPLSNQHDLLSLHHVDHAVAVAELDTDTAAGEDVNGNGTEQQLDGGERRVEGTGTGTGTPFSIPEFGESIPPDQQPEQQQHTPPTSEDPSRKRSHDEMSQSQSQSQQAEGTSADHATDLGFPISDGNEDGEPDGKKQHLDLDTMDHEAFARSLESHNAGHEVLQHGNAEHTLPDHLTSHGDVHIPFDPAQGHADPSGLLGLTLHPPDFSLPDFSVAIGLRIENLDVMDALATRLLGVLAKGPYQETLNIVTRLDTLESQAYRVLVSAFTSLKKLYSEEAFFNADLLGLIDPEQRGVVRKINLATFVSSVFGSTEVGFFHLNEHFLDVFVPDGGRLLKPQGQLFLDLKTQAYISAMTQAERPQHEIIEELFPSILPQLLVARHPHSSKNLSQSETDFINKAQQRREVLEQTTSPEGLAVLGEKYVWQGFLKDVAEYVAKNHESIVGVGGRKRRAGMNGMAKEPQLPKPSRRVQVIPGYPAQHHWQGADGTVVGVPVNVHHEEPALHQYQVQHVQLAQDPNIQYQLPPPPHLVQQHQHVQAAVQQHIVPPPPMFAHEQTAATTLSVVSEGQHQPSVPPREQQQQQQYQQVEQQQTVDSHVQPQPQPQPQPEQSIPPLSGQSECQGPVERVQPQPPSAHGEPHVQQQATLEPTPQPHAAQAPEQQVQPEAAHPQVQVQEPTPQVVPTPPTQEQGQPHLHPQQQEEHAQMQVQPPFPVEQQQQMAVQSHPVSHEATTAATPVPPPAALPVQLQQQMSMPMEAPGTPMAHTPAPSMPQAGTPAPPTPIKPASTPAPEQPVALHKIDPTLSTQQQYERARAAARPNPTRRGKPTQRRHWSKEEEDALFAGLDALKGPHWSQILALYGPGGSISEALKDRTQVQLKDKARNLKLWFLKNNFEVPHYLKCVTGDLKRGRGESLEAEEGEGVEGSPAPKKEKKTKGKGKAGQEGEAAEEAAQEAQDVRDAQNAKAEDLVAPVGGNREYVSKKAEDLAHGHAVQHINGQPGVEGHGQPPALDHNLMPHEPIQQQQLEQQGDAIQLQAVQEYAQQLDPNHQYDPNMQYHHDPTQDMQMNFGVDGQVMHGFEHPYVDYTHHHQQLGVGGDEGDKYNLENMDPALQAAAQEVHEPVAHVEGMHHENGHHEVQAGEVHHPEEYVHHHEQQVEEVHQEGHLPVHAIDPSLR